jgi:hypothetical protein
MHTSDGCFNNIRPAILKKYGVINLIVVEE